MILFRFYTGFIKELGPPRTSWGFTKPSWDFLSLPKTPEVFLGPPRTSCEEFTSHQSRIQSHCSARPCFAQLSSLSFLELPQDLLGLPRKPSEAP